MDTGFLTRMCAFPTWRSPFSSPDLGLRTTGGVFFPPLGHQSSVCRNVEVFSHVEVCFLMRGCVFPCAG